MSPATSFHTACRTVYGGETLTVHCSLKLLNFKLKCACRDTVRGTSCWCCLWEALCACPCLWYWLCVCVTPSVLWGLTTGPGALELWQPPLSQAAGSGNSQQWGWRGKALSTVPCSGCAPQGQSQGEGCEKRLWRGEQGFQCAHGWAHSNATNIILDSGSQARAMEWPGLVLYWALVSPEQFGVASGGFGAERSSPRRCRCLFGAT